MKLFSVSSLIVGSALGFAALSVGASSALASDEHHGAPSHEGHETSGHAAAGHEAAGHEAASAHDHGHHDPTWGDVNWVHGFLGEKEGVEPSLLWRKPGTPVPVGVLLLNTAILFFILGRIGGPAIGQALVDRKKRIAGDIEAASKMKEEATLQLAHYEGKLAEMSAEMERIKLEMREQATSERDRILREAAARREAIEKEARALVEAELLDARQEMAKLAARQAVRLAEQQIIAALSSDDQDRLAKEFLGGLEKRMEVRS